jgi:hypothetical protein
MEAKVVSASGGALGRRQEAIMLGPGVQASYIRGKRDTLDEAGARFERAPLAQPLFLNSVPKSGTHLIRNIVRMFVPEAQQYHADYIQIPNLHQHLGAFDPQRPMVSWGHLLFSDHSAIALKPVRHIVLVRDPYDWVLARARFYLSDEFQGHLNTIKGGAADADTVLNMMIFGVHQKAPTLLDIYTHNAAAWLGTSAVIVRYEDLAEAAGDLESQRSDAYFARFFADCGIERPGDWRERVRTGADRRQSRTARENLTLQVEIPDQLPEAQKRLVEFAAPGLRALLGYR